MLGPDFEIVHQESHEKALPLPVGKEVLANLRPDGWFQRGFTLTEAGLMEYHLAPIQPTSDAARSTPPRGWLVAARLWQAEVLNSLETTSGLRLRLLNGREPAQQSDIRQARLAFVLDIPDGGARQPVRLEAVKIIPLLAALTRQNDQAMMLAAGINGLVLLLLAAGFYWNYSRPVNALLAGAAADGNEAALEPVLKRRDEFGRLAALVRFMHGHRRRASRENAKRRVMERRLMEAVRSREFFARELHDDTLQSLYAMGMTVDAAARDLGRSGHPRAPALSALVAEINRTIAALRVAISGLENRSDDAPRLAGVMERVVRTSCNAGGLEAECDISLDALAALVPDARFHILRLAKELASNAARHSRARAFRLRVVRDHGAVRLSAEDDGIGFSEDEVGRGHGLDNIRRRVQEMGAQSRWETPAGGGSRFAALIPTGHAEQEPPS